MEETKKTVVRTPEEAEAARLLALENALKSVGIEKAIVITLGARGHYTVARVAMSPMEMAAGAVTAQHLAAKLIWGET